MHRTLTVVLLLLSLLSCTATAPTNDELARAQLGPAPEWSMAQVMAEEVLGLLLRDPSSAEIEYGQLHRSWYQVNGWGPIKFAWGIFLHFNAKNGFGGYAGRRALWVYFRDGKIVATTVESKPRFFETVELNGGGLTREQAGLRPDR